MDCYCHLPLRPTYKLFEMESRFKRKSSKLILPKWLFIQILLYSIYSYMPSPSMRTSLVSVHFSQFYITLVTGDTLVVNANYDRFVQSLGEAEHQLRIKLDQRFSKKPIGSASWLAGMGTKAKFLRMSGNLSFHTYCYGLLFSVI